MLTTLFRAVSPFVGRVVGRVRGRVRGRVVGRVVGRKRLAIVGAAFLFVFVAAAVGPMLNFETISAASLKPPMGPGFGTLPPSAGTSTASGKWNALFQLTPGETYTYVLTYDKNRNPQRFPTGAGSSPSGSHGPSLWSWMSGSSWWPSGGGSAGRPGPNSKPLTTGEINFNLARDEIRFWFEVDGVRGTGTAPKDVRALAGAVLVAALTGPEPISQEGMRLLATAFQWVQWYDLFADATFRHGLVWQVSQHPPHRLTAAPYSGRHVYWAELTRGRDVILELGIDLREPLPWDIIAVDGWDVYRAELVSTSGPGLRR